MAVVSFLTRATFLAWRIDIDLAERDGRALAPMGSMGA